MRRTFSVLALAGLFLVAGATAAFAHVTVNPKTAPAGGFATLTFQVPNEMDNATTTKLVVQFPKDHPIADASVKPVDGWTVNVAKSKLTTPITTDDGDTLDESVDTITWTASPAAAIQPGEFQQFLVSVGLPSDATSLTFPALQTYSNGQVVSWVETSTPGGAEPEHPAPVLTLTKGDDASATSPAATTSSDSSSDDSSKTIAIIGLVVAIVALAVAGASFAVRRKTTTAG